MSSRNVYLSSSERQIAPILHRALFIAQQNYVSGERNVGRIVSAAKKVFIYEGCVIPFKRVVCYFEEGCVLF